MSAAAIDGPRIDAARFIGIPFVEGGRDRAGCDCWGLLRMVYGECLGVDLPEWSGLGWSSFDTPADLAAFFADNDDDWIRVGATDARPSDGVMVRTRGDLSHVGVLIDGGRLLHCDRPLGVTAPRIDSIAFRSRAKTYHRHRLMIDGGAA